MKVHVLGCGPAGLLAAHAFAQHDLEVQIHSIRVPSNIKGAQFLHREIPDITDGVEPVEIEFQKWGHKEVYAEKVYGSPDAPCSWDLFDGVVPGWGMLESYGKLWDKYEPLIYDTEIRAPYIMELLAESDTVVFSTITPLGYCYEQEQHQFNWQNVWINEECSIPTATSDDNVIVYNGSKSERWYRSSMLGGHGSTEWGDRVVGTRQGRKPLSTTCDCFLQHHNFVRAGRFGEFKKGLLVHDAYEKALEALK